MTTASWQIELNCYCPKCEEWVDLLDYADFWDGRELEIGERNKNIEVVCPKCGHEFNVETEY